MIPLPRVRGHHNMLDDRSEGDSRPFGFGNATAPARPFGFGNTPPMMPRVSMSMMSGGGGGGGASQCVTHNTAADALAASLCNLRLKETPARMCARLAGSNQYSGAKKQLLWFICAYEGDPEAIPMLTNGSNCFLGIISSNCLLGSSAQLLNTTSTVAADVSPKEIFKAVLKDLFTSNVGILMDVFPTIDGKPPQIVTKAMALCYDHVHQLKLKDEWRVNLAADFRNAMLAARTIIRAHQQPTTPPPPPPPPVAVVASGRGRTATVIV